MLPVAQGMDTAVLRQELALRLDTQAGDPQFIQMPDATLPSLLEALAGTGSAALILQRDMNSCIPILRQCLDSLDCLLLVVQ
jgi:hypothetical protein